MADEKQVNVAPGQRLSPIDRVIKFCMEQKLVVFLVLLAVVAAGVLFAPFDWNIGIERDPVPVDAIPDIGENQQIVFTEWEGRSPHDVENQITYPLTAALLGVPGVKTIRSNSFLGFSSIYVIFNDGVDFYWSRSRVLEKLNSLPPDTLPEGVAPALGPDATALGQVFWYTLEGRDKNNKPTGGWDPQELRTIQDWNVRYALLGAGGVSECASVGGYVLEYQIDVDPDAMRAHRVTLDEIFMAVRQSNIDVGARTIEVNRVEYIVRGLGFIKNISDIENTVVKTNANVPIYVKNIAHVSLGPALRMGALDKGGAEAVGGVVVVRYGENPLQAIKNVKKKIAEISAGLPKKMVTKPDGTKVMSQVTIVPFYDRTGLIYETLGTLNTALLEEILVTIIVVVVMVKHLRSSVLISGLMPLAVLMCFIGMKIFHVDANIMALSGIAIAIGTMVDMGIIICENILKHIAEMKPGDSRMQAVFHGASEVGSAVLTAISTTVVSFLPVFTMTEAEGKLFKPLAYTKTFALIASVVVAITIIPPLAHMLFIKKLSGRGSRTSIGTIVIAIAILAGVWVAWWAGVIIGLFGLYALASQAIPEKVQRMSPYFATGVAALAVMLFLTRHWEPLGPQKGFARNFILVLGMVGGLLMFFLFIQKFYSQILGWCLRHKIIFLAIPALIVLFGLYVWLGPGKLLGGLPESLRIYKEAPPETIKDKGPIEYVKWIVANDWNGRGREFMPPLDEGSFLYMPALMPHAGIGEALDVIQKQDMALSAIPEVESVVGKVGRAESPLDPAHLAMIETVINYKPEYILDEAGHRVNFKYDESKGQFARDLNGELIEDPDGRPFRQWRDSIKSANDIWKEIVKAAEIPGATSAPKLQPIAARIVMLQSGMRAPMGVKIQGPDLESIETAGLQIEKFLKEVPSVEPSAVIADRIVGKPYLEIEIDREAAARYHISVSTVQDVIESGIGGSKITATVEGRRRFPVRVRYQRELRDQIETLGEILVGAPDGTQIPIIQLAKINYVRGPLIIRSEDTFLTGYVLLDKKPGYAEVDVVEQCDKYLKEKLKSGEFVLPPGVTYKFAGAYESQLHSQRTMMIVMPLALFIIFMILYFQFRSVLTTGLVFSGIAVAAAGGFIMIWLYAQPWFLNFSVFGTEMRQLFQVHTINLSVAVWVGFIALFGIASDDGVVMATYLRQHFKAKPVNTIADVREATLHAGLRRIRPCLMTTATTVLALLPVLTSTGRGADVMVPMAVPSFGGMTIEVITMFIVPVLYCAIEESKLKRRLARERSAKPVDFPDGKGVRR
jgi:Cu(I)/Ag(I) efflux system membrane protein CusA/SilA